MINLTGVVSRIGYIPAGSPGPNGKAVNFPRFSAGIRIADSHIDVGDKRIPLTQQTLWVDISCPMSRNKVDEWKVNALINKIESGEQYVLLIDVVLSSWGTPPKYSVRVGYSEFQISSTPFLNLNNVIISGTVVQQATNWLMVEERYNVKGEWKVRQLPIYLPRPCEDLLDATVLVYGRLATKDSNDNRSLYVIAEEVY